MAFAEGLLSKQQVIDEFGIPKNLEADLFAILKPKVGKLYWKKDVDPALEKVLGVGDRPPFADHKSSFEKEDLKVNGVGLVEHANTPWNRIADSLEQLVAVFLPKTTPDNVTPDDVSYTTAQAATLLNRHVDVVREYCRQGVFGVRDASGKWVIRHSEIEKFRIGQLLVHGKGAA